jgi:hypothetical protein
MSYWRREDHRLGLADRKPSLERYMIPQVVEQCMKGYVMFINVICPDNRLGIHFLPAKYAPT